MLAQASGYAPPVENLKGSSRRRTLQVVTKLGGLIGAVLLFALVIYVGDRIDWLADIQNDYIATAILTAVGVVGWLIGSRTARRLTHRRALDTANPSH
jgi:hypothetical protein